MTDYYLRCTEDKVPTLLALATELGILTPTQEVSTPEWVWVPLGVLHENGELLRAPDGQAYWHANLRVDFDLYEWCQEKFRQTPTSTLAYGLAHIGEFFYVDNEGRAVTPNSPSVVFL